MERTKELRRKIRCRISCNQLQGFLLSRKSRCVYDEECQREQQHIALCKVEEGKMSTGESSLHADIAALPEGTSKDYLVAAHQLRL